MLKKNPSFRSMKGSPAPAQLFHEQEDQPYFLDSCSLCRKSLDGNSDIFMYRGDMAFCSEECREEQMEIDETKVRNLRKVSMKTKSSSQKVVTAQRIHATAPGTVVAG